MTKGALHVAPPIQHLLWSNSNIYETCFGLKKAEKDVSNGGGGQLSFNLSTCCSSPKGAEDEHDILLTDRI